MFSVTFFVKGVQAVGADAPLLMVPQKKCSGPALGSPVSTSSKRETHHFAGRTVGRHKYVHESSAGLTPKPRWIIQREEFPIVKRRFGPCGALFVVYPLLWKVGKPHHQALEWSLNQVHAA